MVKTKQSAQSNRTGNKMHSTDPWTAHQNWKTKSSAKTGYLATKATCEGGGGGKAAALQCFSDVSGTTHKKLFLKSAGGLLGLSNSLSVTSNSKQYPHFRRNQQSNKNGVEIKFKKITARGTLRAHTKKNCHLQATKQVSQWWAYETWQATQSLWNGIS